MGQTKKKEVKETIVTYIHGNKTSLFVVVCMLVVVGGLFFTSYSSYKHLELKRLNKINLLLEKKTQLLNEQEIEGIN